MDQKTSIMFMNEINIYTNHLGKKVVKCLL
jgi:hypothetical protein